MTELEWKLAYRFWLAVYRRKWMLLRPVWSADTCF